uniref:Uncharacterized protein n=1 Tax=Arundo donax TaxID=35708 RepID=A0A0A8YUM6_ARUDO
MGSDGGEAAPRRTLGDDLRSGLEAAPAAAAGVRSMITMPGTWTSLDRTPAAATANPDGDEQLSAPL